MKQKLLSKVMLLLFALVAGSTSVWGEISSLTFTAQCKGTGTADDGTSWTVTSDGTESSYDNTLGIHYGTNSAAVKYITLSTSGISGTITQIVVNASCASNVTAVLNVTVGGDDFGTQSQSVSNSGNDYTFTGSASGTIMVTLTKPSSAKKALYVKSITVTYSTGGSSDYINVSSSTKDVTCDAEDVEFTISTDQVLADDPTQFYTTADGDVTTSKPDWITETLYDEGTLLLSVAANPGAARTAYFRVENASVQSEVITINQAAYVATYSFALFNGNLVEGDYIICYDNGGNRAMKNIISGKRLGYELLTPANNVIKTGDGAYIWHIAPSGEYWTIYNADEAKYAAGNGTNNQAQMLEVGTGDNALWTASGTSTYEFVNKGNAGSSVNANLRNNTTYGFACYSTSTGGALSLYKKLAVTLNANGYATFSSAVPIDFSKASDFTAWTITGVSGSAITFSPITEKVAANTGVLLMGTAGETVYPSPAASGRDISATNKLVATTTTTEVAADGDYYGLSGNEFVKVDAGDIPGGKALLPASEVPASVRGLNFVFDNADGINTIHNSQFTMHNYYDLSGRRVVKPTKGLYIVNGKKVVK